MITGRRLVLNLLVANAVTASFAASEIPWQHQHHPTPPPKKAEPPKKETPATKKAEPQHGGHTQRAQHEGHSMRGRLGPWGMAAEGSGTSRLPESSPMFMKHLPSWQGFDMRLMGVATVNYADAGGRRGDEQLFSNSMAMLMGRKDLSSGGICSFSLMGSLDALFNGKKGYPNLFQTGETANGRPLKDRQHPHDLFSEIALTYSLPIGGQNRVFVYGGPVGEPALGGPMYLHRPSGMENPEAPISHHWFDSTHISFGVLTLGLTLGEKWQIEGSLFNGHEPDEDRFDFDPIELNSASGRLTYNPSKNLSVQVSYAFLDEPEELEPGVHQHRMTASAVHSQPLAAGANLSTTLFFGKNTKSGEEETNAFGIEAAYLSGPNSLFGRFERVEKDELVDVPPGKYKINKLTFGATRDLWKRDGFDVGLGAFVGLFDFPSELEPFYGKNPVSWGVFLRIRPSKMP